MTIRGNDLEAAARLIPQFDDYYSSSLNEYYQALDAAKNLIKADLEKDLVTITKNNFTGEAKSLSECQVFNNIEDIKFFLATYYG